MFVRSAGALMKRLDVTTLVSDDPTEAHPSAWPSLPPFSQNNFLEHFSGSDLDSSKWAAVTSGTGTVRVTDSYVGCSSGPTVQSAGFFYYAHKLHKTESQLWTVAISTMTATGPSRYFFIYNSAIPPTPKSIVDWSAN